MPKKPAILLAVAVPAAAAGITAILWKGQPAPVTVHLPNLDATAQPVPPSTPAAPADTAPQPPHDVSLAALGATAFNGSDLTFGAVQAQTATYTRYYVTYRSGELPISGIMNIPRGEGPFPLVILAHGYIDPKIYTNGRGLKREQDYLASNGFAVLHTDYRGHAQSGKDPESEYRLRLGYAEDAINAVYAVRAAIAAGEKKLANVDAEHVGMLGHSMGGGVTLQTITAVPGLLDAAVLFAPVSADARDNFDRWVRSRPEVAAEIVTRYGEPDANPAFWDGISPMAHLSQVQTPVLLHHGTADESCPFAWAEELDAAFTAAGKDMTFYSYAGEPHEFINAWPLVMRRTVEFLRQELR